MDKQMEALAQAMAPGRKTVFFGGAGVSTESASRISGAPAASMGGSMPIRPR